MKKIIKGRTFCDYLEKHDVHYEWCIKHKEVLGCDESSYYYEHYKCYIGDDYCICKNLLLQERKGEKRTFLVVVPSEKQVDLKGLKEQYKTSKLEFVKEEKMQKLLNTAPGNVSIFNLIYDKEKEVNLILDSDLFNSSLLAFHPLYNGMSLFLTGENVFKFLNLCNRDYVVLDIPVKEDCDVKRKVLSA